LTVKQFCCSRRFWGQATKLALPIAFQNLLISSFVLIDTLMVSRLGGNALPAVGMAGQWQWLLNICLFGICSGMSVFIAQYWGKKDIAGIHRVYGTGLVTALTLLLLFFVPAVLSPQLVLRFFTTEAPVIELGASYLGILVWCFPAVTLTNIFSIVLRSTEDVRLPMWASAATTLVNVVLDYGLIFGELGLPAMGVEGAALATVIAAWCGPAIILLVSLVRRNILIAPIAAVFSCPKGWIAEFFRRAMAVMFNESAWGLGTVLYNVIFGHLGAEHFAALTVLRTVENLAFVFFVGFGNAACVMIGKEVGAGDIKEAVHDARRFSLLVPVLGVLIGAVVILLRAPLISLFNVENATLNMDTAMAIMLIYAVQLPVRNIPYIQIVGIFRSGGDTATGAKYDLLTLYGIALPLTFLGAFVFKLPFAVCFALMYLGEDYLKMILCLRHFFSLRWLKPVTEEGRAGLAAYLKK
jgi:putative MATE family efflux protein